MLEWKQKQQNSTPQNKMDVLQTKSNLRIVLQNIRRITGDPTAKLYISSRKGKKFMVENPNTGKWVHFGDINAEDYTYHQDEERRRRFQQRNARWKTADKWSPAYLAYHILW